MFWKDQLCKDIMSHQNSLEYLHSLQKRYPSLRVKTIDAKGRVPVIQLSEKGEWIKPSEWASNHLTAQVQRLLESQQRITDCGSDPYSVCSGACSLVEKLEEKAAQSSFSVKYDRLYRSYQRFLHDITGYILYPEDVTADDKAKIIEYLKRFAIEYKVKYYD